MLRCEPLERRELMTVGLAGVQAVGLWQMSLDISHSTCQGQILSQTAASFTLTGSSQQAGHSVSVDWGDRSAVYHGTFNSGSTATAAHTFASGTFTVMVTCGSDVTRYKLLSNVMALGQVVGKASSTDSLFIVDNGGVKQVCVNAVSGGMLQVLVTSPYCLEYISSRSVAAIYGSLTGSYGAATIAANVMQPAYFSLGDSYDYFFGGGGPDTVLGGRGNEIIFGGKGNNTIIGGTGNDWLYAGSGADVIYGGSGNDYIIAGSGIVSANSGTVTATAGTTGVTVSGSGTGSVTLTGTIAQINNLLAGNSGATLSYIINSDTPPASDVLTLTANDQGNTGSGGALTGSDTATINITAVNDAPTATIVPVSYNATEQTTLPLQGTMSIADVDAGTATVLATVSVNSGTLTATAGTTGVTVSGSGTGSVTLTGTIVQINNLLAGNSGATLSYIINSDTPPASDVLTLTANDQGNTGSGGALTGSDTATINITAVNDAPTATIVPVSYSATEQTTLPLQGTMSIADVDAGAATVLATVSVNSGTLTATAGTTGVAVSGSGTGSVTLTGTIAQINNLLAGNSGATLSYIINSDTPPASDVLTLTANDQGNTGTGGALTGSDTATINITAVNDPPTATIIPTSYSATEQTTLPLQGTGMSIADVDAGTATVKAIVSVNSGTLTATAGTTGVAVSGSGTGSVTLTGTIAQINNLLAGNSGATLSYIINSDTPPASDVLTLTANDQGNTGSGGALTGSDTATINITAVNDAPTATIIPTSYSATEQTTLPLQGTMSIADVDAGAATVQAIVSVNAGTLTATAGSTGAAVSGSATSSVTLTGTIAQINNLLAGNSGATLTYVINSDTPPASDVLTLTANDEGNTGVGGALTGSDAATINITAVNDAPTATIVPASYTRHGADHSAAPRHDVDCRRGRGRGQRCRPSSW